MGEEDAVPGGNGTFDQEQYNRLLRCVQAGDLSEWNKPYLAIVEEIKAISGSDIWMERAGIHDVPAKTRDTTGANLAGAGLAELNLKGIELRDATLERANLYKADLSKASLARAKLAKASLFRANLESADLRDADLTDADLREADL
ncbi:MAG: pentapeptide repeat-containing protein, partial [Methanocorpusculum sp.]|nr:pentapeptide repeat-containing protein [Methanocorpusculum sp.]MDE2522910.1 pentapeptide repeat-containing protein [Methanocorpusculum sp.]MDE2523923.1 pentapeptide repeat-containing protein [Methanocorpusculum sp.]